MWQFTDCVYICIGCISLRVILARKLMTFFFLSFSWKCNEKEKMLSIAWTNIDKDLIKKIHSKRINAKCTWFIQCCNLMNGYKCKIMGRAYILMKKDEDEKKKRECIWNANIHLKESCICISLSWDFRLNCNKIRWQKYLNEKFFILKILSCASSSSSTFPRSLLMLLLFDTFIFLFSF